MKRDNAINKKIDSPKMFCEYINTLYMNIMNDQFTFLSYKDLFNRSLRTSSYSKQNKITYKISTVNHISYLFLS